MLDLSQSRGRTERTRQLTRSHVTAQDDQEEEETLWIDKYGPTYRVSRVCERSAENRLTCLLLGDAG